MQLYIFRSVDKKYSVPFRLFVINQNFKVARFSSLIIAGMCATIFLSRLLVNYSFMQDRKMYLYGLEFLFFASIFYYLGMNLVERLPKKTRLIYKRLIANTYPFIIIFGMMWMSFVAQKSPANNMTMFLFGLLFVSVTWLFTMTGAAIISIVTMLALMAGLLFFQTDPSLLVLNYTAGAIIVIGFYFISRMLYSYHANYFIQLKTIERNNYEINKLSQMKTEMLGIVAHDLRGPINSITALVELADDERTSENERKEYMSLILEACNESQGIVRDLITIVRGESASQLKLTTVSLNKFLERIQQDWSKLVKDKKNIILEKPETDIKMSMDTEKMQRVFDNLVSNAVKFTKPGGTIKVQLKSDTDDIVRISISDNGIGIPPESIPYLFDRFTKAGRLGLNGEKSHGLGLNICKQIVERHKGRIKVESTVGEGTTFHITLPAITATEEKDADLSEVPESAVS